MSGPRHVFLSCGEASGDRYGAALTAALRRRDPDLRISALGGPLLAAAGAEIVQESSAVAVMGVGEVVRSLPQIMRVRRRVGSFLRTEGVDLVVPIDFPGFNARLAGQARRQGLPVFWLIAPQVWAWGDWRTGGFRRKITRLGTILPFETDYFRERGFDVFPMGHPLMEDYGAGFPFEDAVARRERVCDARDGALTIGILPGSRRQELEHLLPVLRVAAQAVTGHLAARGVRFVVSAAPGADRRLLEGALDAKHAVSDEPLPRLLPRLDLALVCSGTASLETALAGVPHELVYRTGALTAFLGRRLLRTPHLGLSNIILGQGVVREHLQDDAAPLPLAESLLRWVARPAERQAFYAHARRLRAMCGAEGVWDRTAAAILECLDGPTSGRTGA